MKPIFTLMALALLCSSCSKNEPELGAARAAENNGTIQGTVFKRDELPFSQFESTRLPVKVAGLWKLRGTGNYLFVGLDGITTTYRDRNDRCLYLTGPDKLTYHRQDRYVLTSKHGAVAQMHYNVERNSMTAYEVTAGGPVNTREMIRVSDTQPEDLPVCSRFENNHPYRS